MLAVGEGGGFEHEETGRNGIASQDRIFPGQWEIVHALGVCDGRKLWGISCSEAGCARLATTSKVEIFSRSHASSGSFVALRQDMRGFCDFVER